MKPKLTTPLLAAIGAVVLVVTLFFSFYFSTSAYRSDGTGIVLPSQSLTTPVVPGHTEQENIQILQEIMATPENVQAMIHTLQRPSSFSRTVENKLYYNGQSYTFTRRQYFKNNACRTDEISEGGAVQRSVLRYQDNVYAWESGSLDYYSGKSGAFTDESQAMLPTYEDVLALPVENILDAGLININYEPSIFVSAQLGEYRNVYYISTVTGLLLSVDVFKGETLVRQCKVSSMKTGEVIGAYFLLPNGKTVVDMEQDESR